MIKGILFDFGGVLADVTPKTIENVDDIKQVLSSHGINYTDEKIRDYIKRGLKRYNEFRKQTTLDLPAYDILKMIFEDEYVYVKLRNTSEELIYLIDPKRDNVKVRPNAYEVLKELNNRGYKLGLISNTITNRVKELMLNNGLSEFMEFELYSHKELIRKPNKEIFQKAVNKINLKPEECVYVGDTIDKDVNGAKNAGFAEAILFDNDGDKESNDDYKVIQKLESLLDMFNG